MVRQPGEGVIRFEVEHESRALEDGFHGGTARTLIAWREVLARLGLVGRDPARYEGLGFGNLSARVDPMEAVPPGERRFLVTGSRTADRRDVTLADFCLVERYDIALNRVKSSGAVPPSSESLTHGAIYDVAPAARVVLHVHAPEIWRRERALGLPLTSPEAPNGTPAMALEVQRVCRETAASGAGIIVMGGHEDGVIAFGPTAEEAGEILVRHFARALAGEGDPQ